MEKITWVAILFIAAITLSSGADARIKRSQSAKVEFKAENPCPSTGARKGPCKGYVIDHINPLACGGADAPSNMQWQTIEEGKAKDKWERKGCALPVEVKPAAASLPVRPATSTAHDSTCYTGPRGGTYTITASGRKNYGGC